MVKINYYEKIKQELINHEVYVKVKDYSKNYHELETYYNIGRLLVEAQKGEKRAKYGDRLIKEYSKRLTEDLGVGYTQTSLKRMRSFFLLLEKGATLSHLSWSHYVELLKYDDINKINYYIRICKEQNLSVRQLREKIKLNEYERLSSITKTKMIKEENLEIGYLIKSPILIENKYSYEDINEKVLKKLILENIPMFLEQLGEGFSFIKDEYKIKIGSNYNYIDLLLFNYKYNCFIVVELKVTELKKEHIGQIEVYMNYIDRKVKNFLQNKTIGIIVCYKNKELIIEYSSDSRIKSVEYNIC